MSPERQPRDRWQRDRGQHEVDFRPGARDPRAATAPPPQYLGAGCPCTPGIQQEGSVSLCPWDPAGQQAALRWERGVGPRETRGDVQHHVPKGTRLRATCRSTGRTPAERRAGRCSSSGQGCVRPKGQEGSEGCREPKATCTTPGRDSRYSACREGRRAVSRAVILKPNQIPAPCGAVPLRRPQGAAGASPPPGPHRPP